MIVPIFLPHGGCPERCGFCDQRVSGGEPTSPKDIAATIEAHLATKSTQSSDPVEVAFYGGTFTDLPRETQRRCLSAVRLFREVTAVRLATRPDSADAGDADWMTRLRDEYLVRVVELGVQSFNPRVLNALGRNQRVETVAETTAVLKRLGLVVGWHLMIGAPGEEASRDDIDMVDRAIVAGVTTVRLHPLLILAGTTLERDWELGRFESWAPLEIEEAIVRLARLVEGFEAAGVRVIRIGLQPNELLGAAVKGGAGHPALGDLVRGRLARQRAEQALRDLFKGGSAKIGGGALLEVPVGELGRLRGPGRANLRWLADRFGLDRVEARAMSSPESAFQARLLPMPESPSRVKGLTHGIRK